MNRLDMARAAVAAVALSILLDQASHADSPPRPLAKKTIWSPNRQYFAVTDPDTKLTTIYRATSSKPPVKVWSMYGWFRDAALADDGQHLVAGYDGINLIPIKHDKNLVMLYFFRRGEVLEYVTLDQIIDDPSKLRRTASHYDWGMCRGLDRDGRYVVETVDGRTLRFDVTNGRPLTDNNGPDKTSKIPVPRP